MTDDDTNTPAASRPAVGREEIAKTIRKALVENWVEDGWKRWDEDVLLTGCKKVGGGKGYDQPERAADALAIDAADAVLALLDTRDDTRAGGDQEQEGGRRPITKAEHDAVVAECARLRKVVSEKTSTINAMKQDIQNGLANIDGDSLDAICEVIGEGSEFATYNKGKSTMRSWFLRRHATLLSEIRTRYEGK